MSQDFAKRHSSKPEDRQAPRFVWFVTGFLSGVFVTFLAFMWQTVPVDSATEALPKPESTAKVEEMQWDFYEIFPKSEVPIIEEYDAQGVKSAALDAHAYIIQTGSFKDPKDADELRAQLLLMGLTTFVKEVDVRGTAWHRVIVGPLKDELALHRAQDELAQAQIASIAFRVKR